jgi:hypothetical protein
MEAEVRIRAVVAWAVLIVAGSVLAGSWGAGALAQTTTGRSLPRVYIFTDVAKPGQPALPGQEARRASVDDLREELRKRPGLLRVVDIPLDADVYVEVVRREALSGSRCLLTVRLRPAGLTTGREFQGEGPTWKEAALLVADSVRRWVNENLSPSGGQVDHDAPAIADYDKVLSLSPTGTDILVTRGLVKFASPN